MLTAPARWLLLIHQIPPRPAYLRVKVGRRLLVFLGNRQFETPELGESVPYQIFSFAEVFRIESVATRTGPREVLLGQGPGMAFERNVDLAHARQDVAHVLKMKGGEKR